MSRCLERVVIRTQVDSDGPGSSSPSITISINANVFDVQHKVGLKNIVIKVKFNLIYILKSLIVRHLFLMMSHEGAAP